MADGGQAIDLEQEGPPNLHSLQTTKPTFPTTKLHMDPGDTTTLVASTTGNLVTRATFLGLFIAIGFVSNSILLSTLAQNNRRRNCALNLFLISIGTLNLLNCIGNMPLILAATVSETWDYGSLVCNINAFCVQFTSVAMIVGLCVLSIDRYVATYSPVLITLIKANCLIIYTWAHAAALSFPLVANLIPVDVFPARYLCSVGREAPAVYISLTLVFGYGLPLLLIMTSYIAIIHKTFRQEQHRRSPSSNGSRDKSLNEELARKETSTSKYIGVLIVLWIILEGPYVILSHIEQFSNSSGAQSGVLRYARELDFMFTWMKLSYPMFLPLVTLCWRKLVWQKLKNLLMCRKSNLIDDASPYHTTEQRNSFCSATGNPDSLRKPREETSAFAVPVLFAAHGGLHVQTYNNTKKSRPVLSPLPTEKEVVESIDKMESSRTSGIVTAKKCDVYESQDFFQFDEDTSDYDSHGENDLFSVSNSLSVHTQGGSRSPLGQGPGGVGTSTHNSEVVLISTKTAKDIEPEDMVLNKESNQLDSGVDLAHNMQGQSLQLESHTSTNKVNDLGQSIRHVRNSSDSGRGSEEGTVSRRERSRPPLTDPKPRDVKRKHHDVTAHDISTGTPVESIKEGNTMIYNDLAKPKDKRKRKRKNNLKDEFCAKSENDEMSITAAERSPIVPGPSLPQVSTPLINDQFDPQGRPPIRLQPIDRETIGSKGQSHLESKMLPKLQKPVLKADLNRNSQSPKVSKDMNSAKPSKVKIHQKMQSGESAICDTVSSTLTVAPHPARRRRSSASPSRAVSRYSASSLGQSDTPDPRPKPRDRRPGFNSQRLANSDSAADRPVQRLDTTEVPQVERSLRRSPKPHEPRRRLDVPKSEKKIQERSPITTR